MTAILFWDKQVFIIAFLPLLAENPVHAGLLVNSASSRTGLNFHGAGPEIP